MKKILKLTLILAALIVAFAFTAYAKNYAVQGESWLTDPEEGRMFAQWERVSNEAEDVTSYKIKLYREDTKHPLTSWITTNSLKYEFTKEIAAKGRGEYFFELYPSKGGKKMKVTSDIFEVDAAFLKTMREYLQDKEADDISTKYNTDGPGGTNRKPGWISMPDGSWAYRDNDGTIVTSEWKDISGKRYYFSADGRMVTQWQSIDGLWYYFDSNGALMRNMMTPDGYVVNADGVWVKNGEPVKSDLPKNKKADTSTVTLVSNMEVKFSEKYYPGEVSTVKISNTSEAKVMDIKYSAEPDTWVMGEPVTIHVTYEVYNGYSFADSVAFTCSKAVVVGHTGDNIDQDVELLYIPTYTLEAPSNIYVDSNNMLRWDPVENAVSYEVRIVYDDTTAKKKTTGYSVSLDDYVDYSPVNVTIRTIGNDSYIRNSAKVTIEDIFDPMVNENLKVGGKLKRSGGQCRYVYDTGDKAVNKWVKVGDYWYHFNANGYAEAPGWFTDTDGQRYYFDKKNRMVTGAQVIDGKAYVFNDGSDPSRSEGALIQ